MGETPHSASSFKPRARRSLVPGQARAPRCPRPRPGGPGPDAPPASLLTLARPKPAPEDSGLSAHAHARLTGRGWLDTRPQGHPHRSP